jgi:hypothetical protein
MQVFVTNMLGCRSSLLVLAVGPRLTHLYNERIMRTP